MIVIIIAAAQASQPGAIELLDAGRRLNGQAPLPPDSASVLTSEQTDERHTMRLQRLSGDTVIEHTGMLNGDEPLCSRLSGRDPVPGPRRVLLDTNTSLTDPTMLLVSGAEGEEVRVSLTPGDQILSVYTTDERGVASEYLELRQGGGRLMMLREGRDSMVCYDSGEPQP
ncbi:MAG: hypothetical protein ACI8RZ_001589 [Myxococcota bacterium]|jgi:hypothetical protein